MADLHEIQAVIEDAVETGAMQNYVRRGGAFPGTKSGVRPQAITKFRAKFRAALEELPPDAMVCEVLTAMENIEC